MAGGRTQPTARMQSVSAGGTRVSDSMPRESELLVEMREMVGCGAGIRLGDKLAVSASAFLPRFLLDLERDTEESSARAS